jgi:hypothetical protein
MRTGVRAVNLRSPMNGSATQQMTLELDPGEPISGRIRVAAGSAQSFRGWVELAGKLDRLRARAHNDHSKDNDEHRPTKSFTPIPPEATR